MDEHESNRGRSGFRRRGASASGQAVPLLAVLLLFAGAVGVGLVHVAAAASRRAAAEAAADATALAGAASGREAAEEVAGANDARVVAYRVAGDDVVVTVERHGATARARARWVMVGDDP